MKEIGGYIQLDKYSMPLMHEEAIALNSGRNCLAYLIHAKSIKKMYLPFLLCDSVEEICNRMDVVVERYPINPDFSISNIDILKDDWLYVVNFYGQLDRSYLQQITSKYKNVIIDNAHAYFDEPLPNIDTLYTCRKFFGVADGGFLYTNAKSKEKYEKDLSYNRMGHLLGRFEKTASEFYDEYVLNENGFDDTETKYMSQLTENLLKGVNYPEVMKARTENYNYLNLHLSKINLLNLRNVNGPYMYPLLLENANDVKKKLLEKKIYIPTLWPNVLKNVAKEKLEWRYAKNILPLPVDQRYNIREMKFIVEGVFECIN